MHARVSMRTCGDARQVEGPVVGQGARDVDVRHVGFHPPNMCTQPDTVIHRSTQVIPGCAPG